MNATPAYTYRMILVVDDNEVQRASFKSLLETNGHQVLESSRSEEAIHLAGIVPELIILTNLDFCKTLRKDKSLSLVPIILVSASEDPMQAMDAGVDAYLPAPVDLMVLLSNVKSWLRVSKAQANENLYEFFMQAPIPMFILEGEEHSFRLANPPYEKLIGRRANGKTLLEVFSKEEISHFIPLFDAVYKTGVPYIGHEESLSIRGEDGKTKDFWIDFGYHAFRDVAGKIKGVLAIVQDVTEQTNAKKLLEVTALELATQTLKFETIIKYAPAGISVMKGENQIFEQVNSKWRELVSDRDYIGKSYEEAFPELASGPLPLIIKEVYHTGKTFVATEMKLKVKTKLGILEDQYFNLSFLQLTDARRLPYGIFCHAVNVTERVESRNQVDENVIELEKERDLRDRFVTALTHDLRTPLTAAKMSAQILERNVGPEFKKFGTRIIKNMDRADMMIRDLLDASKMKAGEEVSLDNSDFNLNEVAKNAIDELSSIHGNRFEIKSSGKIDVFWDSDVFRRIIENLVTNAVKYGSVNSPITINLEKKKELIELSVHNSGNPIPVKDQAYLFEHYKRTESAGKGFQKGWGIGLTLVKGFAKAMGGNISVSSSEEQGTTFSLLLPQDSRRNV